MARHVQSSDRVSGGEMLILKGILLHVLLRQQQQSGSNLALNNTIRTTGGSLEHAQEKRADSKADKNNRHFIFTVNYG